MAGSNGRTVGIHLNWLPSCGVMKSNISRSCSVMSKTAEHTRQKTTEIIGGIQVWIAAKIECLPHPTKDIEDTLRQIAGELTCDKSTIQINIEGERERLVAILYFEMPTQAQNKVVDEIFRVIKMYAWEFYYDLSVSFSRTKPKYAKSRLELCVL